MLLSLIACKKDNLKANFKSKVSGNSVSSVSSLQNLNISKDEIGVIELPASVSQGIRSTFKYYTKVVAPNGKPIHILAQGNWTKEKVAYTRTIMEHYLNNVPSILYGNKDAVTNAIADAHGAMTMFNGANDAKNNSSGVNGQDLQATETVAVGSPEYLDLSVRNAAFEEILHFVHDLGLTPVYPEFQKELEAATVYAMDNQIFTPWGSLPVADYDNELLAAYNDAYWGNLEQKKELNTAYLFLSRNAAESGDVLSSALMTKLLPNYITSTVLISSSFNGTFFLKKDPTLVYTSQSQYYKDVKLLGTNNSNLFGNSMDNYMIGNTGNNEIKGAEGNDVLDGGEGFEDVAIFIGQSSEYSISTIGAESTIVDRKTNRDGTDKLKNIEFIQFSDQRVSL